MISRVLVVLSVAVVINLAAGDPLELHRIDFSDVYQQVRNVAQHVSHGEFRALVSNSIAEAPHLR